MPGEAEQSRSIVSRLDEALRDSSPSAAFILSELNATLTRQAAALSTEDVTIENTLFDDPFPLLLLLCPLLRLADLSPAVRSSVEKLCMHASPKEVAIALCERLAQIGPPREDEQDQDVDGSEDGQDTVWSLEGAVREMIIIVDLYAKVLVRIKAVKPSNFLATATESISTALQSLRREAGTEALPGTQLAEAVLDFKETLVASDWISKTRQACIDLFADFLLSTLLILHQSSPSSLAHSFFHSRYPRYRIPGRLESLADKEGLPWSRIFALADSVGLTDSPLWNRISQKTDASHPPPVPFGALVLLSHRLAATPGSDSEAFNAFGPQPLRDSTAIIIAAMTGEETIVSDNVILFWLWWCAESALVENQEIEEGTVFTLVELMSTLSSLSPNPETRFLAFRLVSSLIVTHTAKREEIQLMLLRDLIENCPFDQMRVAAMGILRDVLTLSFATSKPSLYKSPLLLRELGPTILRFQPNGLLDSSALDMADFLAAHSRSTIEKLGTLYLLLVKDKANETGIRDAQSIAATRQHFLQPLERHICRWEQEIARAEDGSLELAQSGLELGLLEDSLKRVTDVLKETK